MRRGGPVSNNNRISGIQNREQIDVRLDDDLIGRFAVGGECAGSTEPRCIAPPGSAQQAISEYDQTADEKLVVRFPAGAGPATVGVAFLRRTAAMDEGAVSPRRRFGFRGMAVDRIEIDGPFNPAGPGETPGRARLFVCRPADGPDEEPCAAEIVATLARRAFRRPATEDDVERLLWFYRDGRSRGDFEEGIRFAVEAILVSPNFLFRIDRDPASAVPGTPYRVSDIELASRLSFFLWSSIPDDELLEVAVRGRLSDPEGLQAQVQRMLADPRAADSLVGNFATQWLYLRDMRAVVPDPSVFPEFNDNLREAFQRETELFLEHQLREDRSVVELLSADYTFANEELARFYGIPHVYGSHFRRVALDDPNRTGLLGHGSVLTVTSYANRTSPVVRGNYLLKNFLGSPPPPPPPNVPALVEGGEGREPASMRERMEQHRSNPACATCHRWMDPLGFALENFNGIGKWRDREAGRPIDTSGVLPDGTEFDGPVGLRGVLLKRRDEFVLTFTEKLLTYALGRGVEHYDMPAIRKIVRDAAPAGYSWSSLVVGVLKSTPFQMRVAQG